MTSKYKTQCGKNKIYSVKVQNATRLALCSASNLRAREKKKENHCSSRLSRSRCTLSRVYESCLACQRLFLPIYISAVILYYTFSFLFFICYPVLFHLISNYVSSSALSLFGETNKMKNEMKNWKVLDSNPLESLLQQLGMKVKTGQQNQPKTIQTQNTEYSKSNFNSSLHDKLRKGDYHIFPFLFVI